MLVQRRIRSWWLLLPLAVATWALVHASGVHATVAGVLLGFTVPVLRSAGAGGPEPGRAWPSTSSTGSGRSPPGVAVPVFAFFAAGVAVGGWPGSPRRSRDPIALGIVAGLVVGKTVGISGTTWLLSKLTRADLDADLRWLDVLGVAMLAGIGFTVSLLIGELAFGSGSGRDDHVKVGVLCGSLLAAVLAGVLLRPATGPTAASSSKESVDADHDGIPDVYQRDDEAGRRA